MKIWQARIWTDVLQPRQRRGQYAEPWIDLHDDMTVEVQDTIVEDVSRAMTAVLPQLFCIPIQDEAKRGSRWGDLAG